VLFGLLQISRLVAAVQRQKRAKMSWQEGPYQVPWTRTRCTMLRLLMHPGASALGVLMRVQRREGVGVVLGSTVKS
jgi:hypothetical protein